MPLSAPPLRRRLACLTYEGLILLGLSLVTAAVTLWLLHLLGLQQTSATHRVALQITEFVVLTGYGAGFWSGGRQTLPMKVWKISLVTRSGAPLGLGRALWRAVLSWLWVVPALALAAALHLSPGETGWALAAGILLWAGTSLLRKDRQYLHDVLAGTRLVPAPGWPLGGPQANAAGPGACRT
ncbi:MAG: RDD family protein [Thiomonas sp.]|uniref:RDD family protein n=1 Tax=Thiomonas sp. TaxID=2047785 RepID=UPI002A370FE6|nr:RDD family protein [Thiomonas sp.]MDY0331612.1 RDD family protein [Thiomonas sp.]